MTEAASEDVWIPSACSMCYNQCGILAHRQDGTLVKIASSWQFLHQKLGTWEAGKQHAEQFFEVRCFAMGF